MILKSFTDAEAALAGYMPAVVAVTGKDITLERMQPLMELLGHPEQQLRVVHIAGTSGKTSTAYFIAELLTRAGKKVGLTVSPHVQSMNERVQINLQPLPEASFCQELGEFLELITKAKVQPTYYELLIAFAYWYFAKAGVDYAVIETGLGGLHDSTNVASQPDKVCVITDIGIDHTHILGKSLPEIAAQKAGIIYPHNQVFTHQQSPEIMQVIQSATAKNNAKLNVLSNVYEAEQGYSELPLYQQRNWRLARAVVAWLASHDSFLAPDHPLPPTAVTGRMQPLRIGDKTVLFDGAHNQQKMQALVESFQAAYPAQKVPALLALKVQKEFKDILPVLFPIASELILTHYQSDRVLAPQTETAQDMARLAQEHGVAVTIEPNYKQAFQLLITREASLVLVTGSLYLVGRLLNDQPTD